MNISRVSIKPHPNKVETVILIHNIKSIRQRSSEGNICVSAGAKIENQKCLKLDDYTKIIIAKGHDRYFFA